VDFQVSPAKSESKNSQVTLALFHSSLDWRVGHYDANTKQIEYCCTQALLLKNVCSKLNTAIVNTTHTVGAPISVRQPEFVDKTSIREVIIVVDRNCIVVI
jgi:hypothetical protein